MTLGQTITGGLGSVAGSVNKIETNANTGNWWSNNGASVIDTVGRTVSNVFGNRTPVQVKTDAYNQPRRQNVLPMLLLGLVVLGLGFIVYKAVKK